MKPSEKLMFEIYRETGYNRRYKVVYFTELNEHNKETEINRALAGDHFFDGYIKESGKGEAKIIIQELLNRLNSGVELRPEDAERELAEHLA